jgi:hypothetical protein
MPRIDRLSYQEAAKARASARIKQFLVLVLTVIIGILVSVTVNAQSNPKQSGVEKKSGIYHQTDQFSPTK